MNASDVVGYIFRFEVCCNSCFDGDEDLELALVSDENDDEANPIFAQNEGWEEMVCDVCGETLGDVEGVSVS